MGDIFNDRLFRAAVIFPGYYADILLMQSCATRVSRLVASIIPVLFHCVR